MLELIRRRQPVSRADLARFTGIFRSSVSDIVDELSKNDLVAEERAVPSQRGRVPMSLRLNDAGYPVLGLNIRPAYCQIARAGLNGRIHNSLTFQMPASPKKLVQAHRAGHPAMAGRSGPHGRAEIPAHWHRDSRTRGCSFGSHSVDPDAHRARRFSDHSRDFRTDRDRDAGR